MQFVIDIQQAEHWLVQPWHWSFSGAAIALVMLLLLYFNRRFGVSTSFQTLCSIAGAGKWADYFRFDWKQHQWLLTFIGGSIIGAAIASNFMTGSEPLQINPNTAADLQALGVDINNRSGQGFLPTDLFNFQNLLTPEGLILMVGGGFLIGFGTRWAGGCTSGHAISGLSNLQLPSLVAVIGFFIGGLAVTHLLLPLILSI